MNKRAFTLLELLAVISIIGILSAIALPQYRKVVEKGKFTKAQVMAKSLYDSCERMVAEWGVDSYYDINIQNASNDVKDAFRFWRLDVVGASEMPSGFDVGSTHISGAGFYYQLINDNTGVCGDRSCCVQITKPEGTDYAGVTVKYGGNSFSCVVSDEDNEACNVYGLD